MQETFQWMSSFIILHLISFQGGGGGVSHLAYSSLFREDWLAKQTCLFTLPLPSIPNSKHGVAPGSYVGATIQIQFLICT